MNTSFPTSRSATIRFIPWFFILPVVGIMWVFGWALANGQLTIVWLVVILIALGALLFFGEYVSLTLDLDRGQAIITRRRVWRTTRREIPFDEGYTVAVDESSSGDASGASGSTYQALIILKSGERIPLTNHSVSGRRGTQKLVQKISESINQNRITPIVPALDGIVRMANEGETAGIPWKVELFSGNGTRPVTRWFTIEDRLPDGFLMLIPKAGGARLTSMPTGGLLGSAVRFMYQQYLRLLYFRAEDLPGLDQAVTLPDLDTRLAAHYTALTSTPASASAWLTAEVINWSIAWKQPKSQRKGAGLPYLAITDQGLWLVFLDNFYGGENLAEITRLGVALARTHRN